MSNSITVDKITKTYATREGQNVDALTQLDLEVPEGQFVSIVGPSGCGKSTLLRIIMGTIPKTSGKVLYNGREVHGPPKDFGIVFQSASLLPWRTVLANVLVPAQIERRPKDASRKRARELLALVGLDGFEAKLPGELSGGMQQRVAICRALINDPTVLLMDEPFGALDAMTRESLNVELLNIWGRRRKSVLFVTHSVSEAVFLSDRVVVMSSRPGRILDDVVIDLPRPRGPELQNEAAFAEYSSRIRKHLGITEGTVR